MMRSPISPASNIAVFLIICLVSAIISALMGADRNWDLLNYHIYAPYSFLNDRVLNDVGAAFIQGYLNPTADFLNLFLFENLNDHPVAIMAILGFVHGTNFFLVFKVTDLVFRNRGKMDRYLASTFAVAVAGTGAVTMSVLGTTTNDLLVTIPGLLGVFLLLSFINHGSGPKDGNVRPRRYLVLAGVSIGIAVGLKLTLAIFAVALTIALIVTYARTKRDMLDCLLFAGVSGVTYISSIAYHAIYMIKHFQNPFFPFFNEVFRSPYIKPESFQDRRFLPDGVMDALLYPFHWLSTTTGLSIEFTFRDWRFAFAYVAIFLIGLYFVAATTRGRQNRPAAQTESRFVIEKTGLFVVVFWIAGFGLWVSLFGISRYLLPVEMLNGTIMCIFAYLALKRVVLVAGFMIATLATFALTTVYFSWGRDAYGEKFIFAKFPRLPDRSTLFAQGTLPVGFLAPFLPKDVPIYRFGTYMFGLKDKEIFASRVHKRLHDPSRPRFLIVLGRDKNKGTPGAVKLPRGLTLEIEKCAPVSTNVGAYKNKLFLCPIIGRKEAE